MFRLCMESPGRERRAVDCRVKRSEMTGILSLCLSFCLLGWIRSGKEGTSVLSVLCSREEACSWAMLFLLFECGRVEGRFLIEEMRILEVVVSIE